MLKTIVLSDFGNISSRMLHSAIYLAKPKKKDGKYIIAEDYLSKCPLQYIVFA